MAGLVPEPNPSQQRGREIAWGEGQQLFLGSQWALELYSIPRTTRCVRCEVGLAVFFCYLVVFAIGPQRQTRSYRG
jgi:hypothetical protein